MRRLVLLSAARRSLEDIVGLVTEVGSDPAAGECVADKLLAQCERLARLPGSLGRLRSELFPELRSFVAGYLIFFRDQPSALAVVNILHSRPDIEVFLLEGP